HRKADPRDPDLPLWEAEVYWLREDYASAVEVLTRQRETVLEGEANRRKFEDRLIRSQIRLGRFDEAVRGADAGGKVSPLLRAAALAAAGDVTRTGQALDGLVRQHYGPAAFYADPDLGPALRTAPFAPLRQKYPEPTPPADPG